MKAGRQRLMRRVRTLGLPAIAGALLAGAALAAGHHGSTLGKAKHYPLPDADQAREIEVGDVNDDGRRDILVSDNFTPTAYLLLGARHGFKAPVAVDIGNVSHGLALGDVNDDRRADVASAGGLDLTVTIPHDFTTATFPFPSNDVAIADVNRDHHPDIVASGLSDDVGVVLNSGTGVGGQTPHPYPTGAAPIAVAVSKIDGDKNPDVAVLMNQDGVGAEMQVLRGDGNGAFTAGPIRILATSEADGMVAADFNGDHRLDYAVTQGCVIDEPPGVLLVLGKKGGFRAPRHTKAPKGTCADGPGAGDVNGDGRLDLVTTLANGAHPGSIDVFPGRRGGRLGKPKRFAAVGAAQSATVAKLNGDKRTDVAVADSQVPSVAVLYGKPR